MSPSFCKRYGPVRTSIHHPQVDSVMELNHILKGMLRKIVTEELWRWDVLLPYLLFGIWEVTQSVGFSPFDLLGVLNLLNETREMQGMKAQNVVQYILRLRE